MMNDYESTGVIPMRTVESSEQGFVLLTVLLFLGLISALAVQIMAGSLSMSRESATWSASVRQTLALDAALNRVIHAIANPEDRLLSAIRSSSSGVPWQFDGADIRIELAAESGKLDLNTADVQLLSVVSERLFQDDRSVAEGIVSRISKWRQSGRQFDFPEAVLSGSDQFRYPVEIVRKVFTVLTRQTGLDPATASELLLRALPGQTSDNVSKLMSARARGQLDTSVISPELQSFVVRERPIYTVGAELVSNDIYARREAVILIEPNSQIARVLSWRSIIKPLPRHP